MLTRGAPDNFAGWAANEVSSLGAGRMNAIWAAHGTRSIIRWRASRRDDVANCVDYFMQRFDVNSTWNLFHAMRDARSWSSVMWNGEVWPWNAQATDTPREQYRVAGDQFCRNGANTPSFYV